MLILNNVDLNADMKLSMSSVHWLVDNCPNLTHLGNLRSWKSIDYYNVESVNFYRSESELSQFKEQIRLNNWDLDLEIENLNFLYTWIFPLTVVYKINWNFPPYCQKSQILWFYKQKVTLWYLWYRQVRNRVKSCQETTFEFWYFFFYWTTILFD